MSNEIFSGDVEDGLFIYFSFNTFLRFMKLMPSMLSLLFNYLIKYLCRRSYLYNLQK